MKYGIDTRCQHLADDNKDEIYGAISYPIYQSATFARDRVGGGSGYDYSRLQNPTREHLEKIVASLEEGIDALAFSTGMAAITALRFSNRAITSSLMRIFMEEASVCSTASM